MRKNLKELINNIKVILEEKDYTTREAVMAGIILLLTGIVIGVFFSPKKHTMIGSNNGSNNSGNEAFSPWEDEEEEDD